MCLPHVDVSASNLDPSSLRGCTATLSLDPSPRNPHLYNIDPVTFLPQNIMKVTIKKWNTVATWRWDIPEDDVCGICQVHFDGTCPTCKYPGDDCSLLSGKCGHNFHMHCILEWIKQDSSRGQCPMCRQRFEWNEQLKEPVTQAE